MKTRIRENTNVRACEKHGKRYMGWLITSVALMMLTAVLGTATAISLSATRKAQAAVAQSYERSLYDLGDNMHNIEVNLSKLMISSDGKYSATLLTDIYSQATAAGKSLDGLPVDWQMSRETAAFLNKIADFSASYQKSLLTGRSTTSFRANLDTLYETARNLGESVGESVLAASEGKLHFRSTTTSKPFEYRSQETIRHDTLEYPELIYDGPFSDGRKDDEYKYIERLADVDEAAAEKIVRYALSDVFDRAHLTVTEQSDREPMYEIAASADDREAYATVTRRGGKLVTLTVSRALGATMIEKARAQELAVRYAAAFGYDVQPVWYAALDGVAYVNLAPMPDGIVCYPDLVKVKIALDNGDILGIDAKNYCLNHTERHGTLRMNKAAVPTLIDSRLHIDAVRGAFIPMETGGERLCYEVAATLGDLRYFVYLDADDGEMVQIMRVIDGGEQGTLVL